MATSYLDYNGLKILMRLFKDYFRTKHETALRAGLQLKEITSDFGEEVDGNNKLLQGKYYYNTTPLTKVKTYPYQPVDTDIMGEVVIEFIPKDEMKFNDIFEFGDNMEVVWKNSKNLPNILSSNQTYQLRLTTSNRTINDKYRMFADITNFEELIVPDTQCIEIHYKAKAGDRIQLFNKNWLNDMYSNYRDAIEGVYFSADGGTKWSKLNINDLRVDNTAKLIGDTGMTKVAFKEGNDISLGFILYDVDFDEFYVREVSNTLCGVKNAFGSSKIRQASTVDLLGLTGRKTYNSYSSMFANRLVSDIQLFGTNCGLQTAGVEDASYMFKNALNESNCIQVLNMMNGVLTSCQNFTEMLYGCKLTGYDFSNWKGTTGASEIILDGMFEKSSVTDNQMVGIFSFMKNIGLSNSGHINKYSVKRMFKETSIIDASVLEFSNINTNSILSGASKSINLCMDNMFEKCYLLHNAPKMKLENIVNLSCSNMFLNAGTLDTYGNFLSEIANWELIPAKKDPCTLDFQSMFVNCPLYRTGTFRFLKELTIDDKTRMNTSLMFAYTCMPEGQSDKINDYTLYINIITPAEGEHLMLEEYEIYSMLDKLNSGITYVPYAKNKQPSQLFRMLMNGIQDDLNRGVTNKNNIIASSLAYH